MRKMKADTLLVFAERLSEFCGQLWEGNCLGKRLFVLSLDEAVQDLWQFQGALPRKSEPCAKYEIVI